MSWKLTVTLILLAVPAVAGLEALKVILFPHLTLLMWRVVTGTLSCIIGGAIALAVMRHHTKLLAMHTRAEQKLDLERNLLRTVGDGHLALAALATEPFD